MIVSAGLTAAALLALERGVHHALLHGLRAPRLPHPAAAPGLLPTAQTVRLHTTGGKTLFAWYASPAGLQPGPAVVVLHGWGANAALMLPAAAPLCAAGWGVLVLDARCHGLSDDEPFTSMPRFAEDMAAGLAWLRGRPEVDAQRLAVLGHSVGAAAALLCATREPALRAVVSLSAFAHPREMMLRFLAEKGIPYPVLGWYALQHVQRVIGHRFDDIAPLNTLPRLACPVLIAHGEDDETVPVSDAHRLLARRSHEAVRLMCVPGGHDLSTALADHGTALQHFLASAFAPR